MKFLYLVACNLRRKKLRTLLTLLSIGIAFFLFGLLGALKLALTGDVSIANADRLMTRHKVSIIQMIPISYQARIAAIPGVSGVTAQTWFGGIYQDPKNFFASMPVEPDEFLKMYPEFVVSDAHRQAWRTTRNGAIVGRTLMERFNWKVGDRIPLSAPIWRHADGRDAWEFEIVGTYEAARKSVDTSQFFFRYDYFDEGRGQNKGTISWFAVRVSDAARADAISAALDREFANSAYETKTEPEAAMMQGFAQQVGDIGAIITGILGAVFFTILLVSGNTITQGVRERTEEIGVLKALGFTNTLVLGLVLAESCLLAVLGGVGGLGAAWLMTIGGSPLPSLLPVFYVPTPHLMLGAGLMVALGLITGALPALQAMRLGVSEALRRQA